LGSEVGTLMARTWTLFDTITVDVPNIPSRALTKDGLLYFRTTESVYEWDGASATQIASSSTFPNSPVGGSSAALADLCVFDDELFVGIVYNDANDPDEVYRYVSGTTWAQDAVLEDEDSSFPYPHFASMPTANEGRYFFMDCDATYMFMATRQAASAGQTVGRYIARNTSGAYVAATMPGGGYDSPQPQLVGLSKGSQYGSVVGVQRTGADTYRAIQRGSPNFSDLSGSNIGDKRLIGYADGKSFWSVADGGNWELRYSTDWGVNLTAAGNVEHPGTGNRSGFVFKDCGTEDAIMMAVSNADNQVYVWDPGSDTFVADGTISATLTIFDFFVFNGGLYLLSNSLTSNSVDIWYGGQLTSAAFYYGRGNLQSRAALPFAFLNIGGLAVPYPYAVLGAGVSGSPMVAYAGPADSYASFTDFTGALSDDPIKAFDSTPWGDAQGAAESGEDAGPGGGLSDGKC
jgi:hypothetical protein